MSNPKALANLIAYLLIFDPFEVLKKKKMYQPGSMIECPKTQFPTWKLSPEEKADFEQGLTKISLFVLERLKKKNS